MVRRKFDFGKIDAYGRGRKANRVTVEVELRANRDGFPVFSASGDVWNTKDTDIIMGGQMLDDVKHVPKNDPLFQEIKRLWKKHHLNDVHAGTKRQEDALIKAGITGRNYTYERAIAYLKNKGLYEVVLTPTEKRYNPRYAGKPYRYGSGWLYRPIPKTDLAKINRILKG